MSLVSKGSDYPLVLDLFAVRRRAIRTRSAGISSVIPTLSFTVMCRTAWSAAFCRSDCFKRGSTPLADFPLHKTQ